MDIKVKDASVNTSRRKYILLALMALAVILFVHMSIFKSNTSDTSVFVIQSSTVAANATAATHSNTATDAPYVKNLYDSGHFVKNSDICSDEGQRLKLLILIMSAPSDEASRVAIRQSWGNLSQVKDIAIGFTIGLTLNATLEISLDEENNLYKDLIRGNSIDNYDNLTLKTMSMLEWSSSYCSKAKYLLKADDDMFINVPELMTFIDKHINDTMVIFGRLFHKAKPFRYKSKYTVPYTQFKPSIFPDFLTGPAYLLSMDLVPKIYNAGLNYTFLRLEDVFTTGIVGPAVGAKLVAVEDFRNVRISFFNPCVIKNVITIHEIKPSEQLKLTNMVSETSRSNCKFRLG